MNNFNICKLSWNMSSSLSRDNSNKENAERFSPIIIFLLLRVATVKSWEQKRSQFAVLFFYLVKSQKISYSFTWILPDYVAHEITQEFWKNSYFKNMTASFLLRCQNLLRYFTPKMMHFQAWKKLIFTNIAL